jgi:hypothetical protein
MAALEAEAADYVERRRPERDPAGQALGCAQWSSAGAQAYPGRGDGGAAGAAGQRSPA